MQSYPDLTIATTLHNNLDRWMEMARSFEREAGLPSEIIVVDDASTTHEPVQITGKRSNAVLVSEADWRSIQETLFLLSIPRMRDSIRKGLKEPLSKSSRTLDW